MFLALLRRCCVFLEGVIWVWRWVLVESSLVLSASFNLACVSANLAFLCFGFASRLDFPLDGQDKVTLAWLNF